MKNSELESEIELELVELALSTYYFILDLNPVGSWAARCNILDIELRRFFY